MQKIVIKPIAIGNIEEKRDTGQILFYVDVQLENEEWVTWVVPYNPVFNLTNEGKNGEPQ